MRTDKAERLLKIAETDPELASKIADFMKDEEKPAQSMVSNGQPIDVHIIKSEADKIQITPSQKKWAKRSLISILSAVAIVLMAVIGGAISMANNNQGLVILIFGSGMVLTIIAITFHQFCTYKATKGAFNQLYSKYIKLN